ncbi:TetR/AcrR family transcriptional regulator [Longispora urticae]
MPRPRSLTHADIATAALAVLDRDGPAALTMRAVATELGVGTMSLYRYVTDREQVESLVVDAVLAGVDDRPPPGDWTGRVTALCGRIRVAVGAHPAVVPLLLVHRHTSVGTVRWGESVLSVLTGAGFAGAARVTAFRSVLSYVLGALQVEHLSPLSGGGTAALARLPRSEYPTLSATAVDARDVTADQQFDVGLAALLHGLDAHRS